jgi:hypothetical protein
MRWHRSTEYAFIAAQYATHGQCFCPPLYCRLHNAGRAATRIAGRAACLPFCRPPCPPTSLISVTSLRCHIPHGGEFHHVP